MVVATTTIQCESKKHGAHGLDAIRNIFHDPFVRDCSAFRIDSVIAVETGGDLGEEISIFQQIAGHLFHDELIERHVVIQRHDEPVTPNPHVSEPIILITISVGVAGCLQPIQCHMLAIAF